MNARSADAGQRVVLATANPHKTHELAEVLNRVLPGWQIVPRPPDVAEVIEDADSFLGNARLKARALVAATGDSALADDSGLVVDRLGGAPGVHSARFAGPAATDADNVDKLLRDLEARGATTEQARRARFVCVIVLAHPDGSEVIAEGSVEGVIATEPRGSFGFGYDPVFQPLQGTGDTFAQMSPDEKNAMSHRGRALQALADSLGRTV